MSSGKKSFKSEKYTCQFCKKKISINKYRMHNCKKLKKKNGNIRSNS